MVRIDCNIRKKRKEMNLKILQGKWKEGYKMNDKERNDQKHENGK